MTEKHIHDALEFEDFWDTLHDITERLELHESVGEFMEHGDRLTEEYSDDTYRHDPNPVNQAYRNNRLMVGDAGQCIEYCMTALRDTNTTAIRHALHLIADALKEKHMVASLASSEGAPNDEAVDIIRGAWRRAYDAGAGILLDAMAAWQTQLDALPEQELLHVSEREILSAMLELGAVDSDNRKTADKIAQRAQPSGDGNSIKKKMSRLKTLGLVDSRSGGGGGTWLTPRGIDRAKSITG